MSCNGCRVLRKGCSQDCVLRPSIQWINSSESQANATIFLAKFYGRAGLINLINAGPTHLRHVIFGSLLYEACGRIINPVHGSVGLMSSGNWPQCQAAVEAVLQGRPLAMQVSGDDDSSSAATDGHSIMPLKSCDIRHLSKDSAAALHRVKTPHRFKRSAKKRVDSVATEFMNELESKFTITGWDSFEDNKNFDDHQLNRAPSHDSFSVETVEQALINRDELVRGVKPAPSCPGNGDQNDIELELTLGLSQVGHPYLSTVIDISNGES